jgi:hypothetical protein
VASYSCFPSLLSKSHFIDHPAACSVRPSWCSHASATHPLKMATSFMEAVDKAFLGHFTREEIGLFSSFNVSEIPDPWKSRKVMERTPHV